MTADKKFEELKKDMIDKFFEKNPHFASSLGLHDPYDYLLPRARTHTGEYRGLAPTGKKFTEASVFIYRIVDGKVVEGWTVSDELDFLKQLGVIEYKGFPEDV